MELPARRRLRTEAPKNLPEEVISEIIARLPVKAIGRCRCLSKAWNSLVAHPYFINKQRLTNGRNHVIVCSNSSYEVLESCTKPKELRFPDEAVEVDRYFLTGSCEGLLGLHAWNKIVLWNPFVNKFKIIPRPPRHDDNRKSRDPLPDFIGFGFVPQTCDYQVITLKQVLSGGWPQIQTYSLKADAWRRRSINDDDYPNNNTNIYLLVNDNPSLSPFPCVKGNAHWIMLKAQRGKKEEEAIISGIIILVYDLLLEEFREIPLPPTKVITLEVTGFKETIAVITQPVKSRWEIWVMKDYGVESSWTMLYNLGHLDKSVPTHVLNDGHVILHDCKGAWALYDPNSRKHTRVGCPGVVYWKIAICKETLTLLV